MKCVMRVALIMVGISFFFLSAGPLKAEITINTVAKDGTVSVWYRDGSTWKPLNISVNGEGRHLILADGTGRGAKDIYVAASSGLSRIFNTSSNTIAFESLASWNCYSLAAGDVDSNGKLDIVFGDDYWYRKFEYNGKSWAAAQILPTGCWNVGTTIGDSDHDGTNEIGFWTGKQNPLGGSCEWNGTKFVQRPSDGGVYWLSNTARGGVDVDGDKIVDSVVPGAAGVYKYDFAGKDSAPRRTVIIKNDTNNRGVALGNLDGAGMEVVICCDAPSVRVWKYDSGVWKFTRIDDTVLLNALDAFDLDGDGRDELFGVSPAGEIYLWDFDGKEYKKTVLVKETKLEFTDIAVGDVGISAASR
ncbi:MAG: VCBS repeat-containing protein [Candidatus Omnitrophota bacterium]